MAVFNVSADDTSPLISYSPAGAWTDSPNNDTNAPLYSQRSWHLSSVQGASATIQFNGTGIWFYGAKRPGYGSYSVSVDGQSVSGDARSQEASFRQLLGGRSGLTNGPHSAVLTNTGSGSPVDLDAIVFETQVGSTDTKMTETTMDDTNPAITYLPKSGDWVFDKLRGCYNNTIHFTETRGAQAQLAFNGEAVAVYGTVSPEHADYTVTTDGVTKSFPSGSNGLANSLHMGTLLYFASGLTDGPHDLTLTANSTQSGQDRTGKFMDIDKIVVLSTSNGTSTTNDNGAATPSSAVDTINSQGEKNMVNASTSVFPPHKPNVAVIVGVIWGSLMLLVLLITLAILIFRRRPVQITGLRSKVDTIRRRRTPKLPIQTPPLSGISPGIPAEEEISFEGDAREKMPAVPEMSVVRDAYGDGWSGKLRDQSNARPTVPVRPARPPALDLPTECMPYGTQLSRA